MCLQAATSFRACSGVLGLLKNRLAEFDSRPAANTVQSWLLRIGLYELQRPRQQADDWVLLVDHTVQLGTAKCLLIVGIRQSQWEQLDRPLVLSDLSPIALDLVETSNFKIVDRQLREAAEKVGVPRAILSDQGTDIVKGSRLFQQSHSNTLVCKDIAHATAVVLKKELTRDERWNSFVAKCGATQPKVKQTELGYLAPAKLKVKGRYMNLGRLFRWGINMLATLDKPAADRPKDVNLQRLDEKFGWVTDYRPALDEWKGLHEIKNCVLKFGRVEGYHAAAANQLQSLLAPLTVYESGQRVAAELVEVVRMQSSLLRSQERLPASTEVLECLIGKGKRLSGQHTRDGFTKNVLGMAASLVELTDETIRTALETCREADLRQWCTGTIGASLTALRRRVLPAQTGTNSG